MSAETSPFLELYRLEGTAPHARLVRVDEIDTATHVGLAVVQRLRQAHARERAALQDAVARLEEQLRDQHAAAHQAQAQVTELRQALERLVAKNTALIGEKRRLRDALIGRHPLPAIHYRIDLDREGRASETVVETLDAFPHKERRIDAVREARHLAARYDGTLRSVRLDREAWRAVIQRPLPA